MTRTFRIAVFLAGACWAVPAVAQTPAAANAQPSTSKPMVNLGYIGVNGGPAVVKSATGSFGIDAGMRAWHNLDLIGELAWVGDVATRRQLSRVSKFASDLGANQGGDASGALKVPAVYGGVGARWVFENIKLSVLRPYVLVTVGGGRTELKPTIMLKGANVTGSLADYKATLGSDLIGKRNGSEVTGGFGVLMGYGDWYFDASVRASSVASGPDPRVTLMRLALGGGRRF